MVDKTLLVSEKLTLAQQMVLKGELAKAIVNAKKLQALSPENTSKVEVVMPEWVQETLHYKYSISCTLDGMDDMIALLGEWEVGVDGEMVTLVKTFVSVNDTHFELSKMVKLFLSCIL